MDDYITVEQAARQWGITNRRVQKLCSEGRIPGAAHFGKSWAIPAGAAKPPDGRTANAGENIGQAEAGKTL